MQIKGYNCSKITIVLYIVCQHRTMYVHVVAIEFFLLFLHMLICILAIYVVIISNITNVCIPSDVASYIGYLLYTKTHKNLQGIFTIMIGLVTLVRLLCAGSDKKCLPRLIKPIMCS